MLTNTPTRPLGFSLLVFLFLAHANTYGQQSAKMGEVRFTADTQDERDAGVWIDGKYAGYVKELKGNRKVMLPAGEHEISIRQAGYKDLDQKHSWWTRIEYPSRRSPWCWKRTRR